MGPLNGVEQWSSRVPETIAGTSDMRHCINLMNGSGIPGHNHDGEDVVLPGTEKGLP